MKVGEELRRIRTFTGLSLSEAARRSGISKSSISEWESDKKTPTQELALALLDVLGTDEGTRSAILARCARGYAELTAEPEGYGRPVEVFEILRAIRVKNRITQSFAARELGVTQSALAKWESGCGEVTDNLLPRWASAIGASTAELESIRELPLGVPIDSEDIFGRIAAIDGLPFPIQESAYMVLQRELWHRAMRQTSEFGLVVVVASIRANHYFFQGRRRELSSLSSEILRLTERYGLWDDGSLSYLSRLLARAEGKAISKPEMHRKMIQYTGQMSNARMKKYLISRFSDANEAKRLRTEVEAISASSTSIYHRVLPYELDLHAAFAYELDGDPESAAELLHKHLGDYSVTDWSFLTEPLLLYYYEFMVQSGLLPPDFDRNFALVPMDLLPVELVDRWTRLRNRVHRMRAA